MATQWGNVYIKHKYINICISICRTSRKQWPSHARRHKDKALLRNHRCFCSCLYNFKLTIKTSIAASVRLTSDWLRLSVSTTYVTWSLADGAGRGEVNTCTWCRRGCYYYLCCCCAVSAVWRGRVTSAVQGFLHPPPRPSPSLTVSAGSGTIASPVIAKHTEEFCQFTIPFLYGNGL